MNLYPWVVVHVTAVMLFVIAHGGLGVCRPSPSKRART
jgi:hypothetical protein